MLPESEALAVQAEGDTPHAAGEAFDASVAAVPSEDERLLSGHRIPNAHGPVPWLAEANRLPSGLKATQKTASECPLGREDRLPPWVASQTLIPSMPDDASHLPSGLKETP